MENEGLVGKTVQRSNLVLMVLAVMGVFVVLAAAALQSRYLYNFIKGPFPISQSELTVLSNPSGRLQYFVTVTGDDVEDTGFQLVTTQEDGTEQVDQYYFALQISDRWLLVRSASGEMERQVSGALIPLPADEEKQIIGNLETQIPDLQGAFLPMLLDANDFRKDKYWEAGIGAAVLILGVFLALLALWRSRDPLNHPIMKALSVYGDPSVIAAQIENEMNLGPAIIGQASIGSSWLVHKTWLNLSVMRIQDVVWIYKKVIQHRTYGVPTGKNYLAVILDLKGKTLSISAKEAVVDEILQSMMVKAPWAVRGYSGELAALWRKDRQGFIQAVNQRKISTGLQ